MLPLSTHPHQHLFFSGFWMMVILNRGEVEPYFVMPSNPENFAFHVSVNHLYLKVCPYLKWIVCSRKDREHFLCLNL